VSQRLAESRCVPHPLIEPPTVDEPPSDYLARIGEVFTIFDQQDSGNVSYGVRVGGDRYFVKTAGDPGDTAPYFDHAGRVTLLRNAAVLAGRVRHRALTELEGVVESSVGPMLVYRWADGELVGAHRGKRDDPASAFQRFRALPVTEIEAVLDTVYDAHLVLAADGWVAADLYDGCLIYDFATRRVTLMDLDTYQQAPFTNQMGRMFGSDRFMSPEEFRLGATIDQRTTTFTLARLAQVFLSGGPDGTFDAATFRGSRERSDVLHRATRPDPADRYPTVAEFAEAWSSAGR